MANGFIKMAMGALVVIIITAGVILPMFATAETTAGPAVVYSNGGDDPILLDYYDDDFTMTIDEDRKATVGDYSFTPGDSASPRILFWEYGRMYMNPITTDSWGRFYDYRTGASTGYTYPITVNYDYSEKTLTVTKTADDTLVTQFVAESVMTLAANGKYVYLPSANTYGAYYNEKVAADGTLGVLDGTITYNDTTVEVIVNKEGVNLYGLDDDVEYTATVEVVGGELVPGTTDIYYHGTPTVTITIGDDVFTITQYRFGNAILKDISGHEASGVTYTIVSILPVIILVGVLMMVVTAFISNRRA